MQTLVERGCGLDVHQATVVACLLTVGKGDKVLRVRRKRQRLRPNPPIASAPAEYISGPLQRTAPAHLSIEY